MSKEETQELPAGWRWAKLGDISEVVSKGTTPTSLGHSFSATGFPFLRAEDVQGGAVDDKNAKFCITEETHNALARSQLYPGDFLITIAGTLGRVGYISQDSPVMNCNQAVAFVRLKSDVADPAFVCYVCSLRDVMAPLLSMSAGGAIQNLNLLQVRDLSIPLPPLSEQKRIAAILTGQMAAVETARTAAEARLKAAKEMPSAYLLEVFESEEAQGWPRRTLGDVLTRIEAGKSFQTTERLAASDEVGVLKVSAVTWADFRPQEAKATEGSYEPSPHHRVRKGDILITRANTKELVGAVVHVDADYPNRLLSDKTLRLVVDETRISHGFLLQALRMPDARKHIEGNATGTSDSMRNIAQDTIKAIPLPLPPLAEQKRIESFLSVKARAIGIATSAASEELATIKSLPAALLRQAITGKF